MNLANRKTDLALKIHPLFFKGISPKMAAIVGYIIGIEGLTNPWITEMVVTGDGRVLVSTNRDPGHNNMLGTYEELRTNWRGYLEAAGVTPEEEAVLEDAFRERVRIT